MGIELHRQFPFLDVVCSGEADHVFPDLVRRIRNKQSLYELGGVTFRENGKTVVASAPQSFVSNLNELPYPDHSDFFRDFEASSVHSLLAAEVTMETSRGCWWGQKHHCTFCGLNGMGMTYRSKTPESRKWQVYRVFRRGSCPMMPAMGPLISSLARAHGARLGFALLFRT